VQGESAVIGAESLARVYIDTNLVNSTQSLTLTDTVSFTGLAMLLHYKVCHAQPGVFVRSQSFVLAECWPPTFAIFSLIF